MSAVTIEEIPLPTALDGSRAAADFIQTTVVRNALEEAGYGTPDVRMSAERLFALWSDPHARHRLFAGRDETGRIVARGMLESMLEEPAGACWIDVHVLPEAQRHGVGTAMAERVEAAARAAGHSHAIAYIVSPEAPGERLVPATRSGSLPAGNREVRLLLARGYRLEQIVRTSRLQLPVEPHELDARLRAARERTGEAYRIHVWTGRTPVRFLDDMAIFRTRMSTDAPQGGLDEPEDPWTSDRVIEHESRTASEESVLLTVAAELLGEGRLVGFTQLDVPIDRTRAVTQEDTLVLREHRGHGLGMLLKLENLAQFQREQPGHPSVLTWNADENRHMLAVNEALGFTPMAYMGAWRLDL